MKKSKPELSRKIRNRLLPLLLLSLLQIGCSKDLYDDSRNSKDKSFSENVLSEVRNFFEDNATDLQSVDFNFDVKTKSSKKVSNITPLWNGAAITRKDSITTVEMPLTGDFSKLSRIIRRSSTHKAYGFITRVTTKLVIQKHGRTNDFRQFVVTMIDDSPQARKKDNTRNYSGKSDFSGYIIISSLEGKYLESFRSVNGVWSRIYMEASSGKEPENANQTTSLRMLSPDATPKNYSFGEMDASCSTCTNPIGLCSCCKVCNGSYWGCSACNVIVYPDCQECGNRTNECVCCSWCNNSPCTCYTPPQVCSDCNRVNCICSSFICSKCGGRYCNGSCQGSGGGGGTTPPTEPTSCIHCKRTDCSGECQECDHEVCLVCKKQIATATRASVCDSHLYCKNNGNCVGIMLNVSKTEVNISGVYNIIADITTSNLSNISNVSIEIKTYNSGMWVQLNNDASNNQMGITNKTNSSDGKCYTFERKAITGGKCLIRARVDIGNDCYYSNETSILEKAPSRSTIKADKDVKSHFESQWTDTKDFARNSTNNEIKEYGCVVLIDPLTEKYLFNDCEGPSVKVDANFNQANIVHTISTTIRNPNSSDPIEVAFFHTHPPLTYGDKSFRGSILSGPSAIDNSNANNVKIPGFVWCYSALIKVKHGIDDPNGIVEYGYEQREF